MTVTVNEAMLHIMALDPDASVQFSPYTGKWFVSARIDIGDGAVLASVTEHRSDMAEAVTAYLERLKKVDVNDIEHFLVTGCLGGDRRHWRWNGATFVQEPLPIPAAT